MNCTWEKLNWKKFKYDIVVHTIMGSLKCSEIQSGFALKILQTKKDNLNAHAQISE